MIRLGCFCSLSSTARFVLAASAVPGPKPHWLQVSLQCLGHSRIGFSWSCSVPFTSSMASTAPAVSLKAALPSAALAVSWSQPHCLQLLLQCLGHSPIGFSYSCSLPCTTSSPLAACAVSRSQPHWLQMSLQCLSHSPFGFTGPCIAAVAASLALVALSVSRSEPHWPQLLLQCLDHIHIGFICSCSVSVTDSLSSAAPEVSWS